MEQLMAGCKNLNLVLSIKIIKEMLINFGRDRLQHYPPPIIDGTAAEKVTNIKFLGVPSSRLDLNHQHDRHYQEGPMAPPPLLETKGGKFSLSIPHHLL